MDTTKFPQLIDRLYTLVAELEVMFPGRHFTPDGHMVGSIGEALAAYYYGLKLLTASTPGCDAMIEGRRVEIKATQGTRVAFRCAPAHLLVLKLHKDGGFTEIYNGTGERVWALVRHKKMPKNGQHQISLTTLRVLNGEVDSAERMERRR